MAEVDVGSRGRSVGRGRKLIIGVALALGVLFALEGLCRVVVGQAARGEIYAVTQAGHVRGGMKFDPDLGWTWPELPSPFIGINAHGFRNPEMPILPPEGTWRAIALGDSQTFGAGVMPGDSWPLLTQATLQGALGPDSPTKVEVLNAGISGYTSLQALRLMTLRHRPFKPDVYLVDVRSYDSRRDQPDLPLFGLPPALGPILFKSSLYYGLTLALKRLRPAPKPHKDYRPPDPTNPPRTKAWYNHDLILQEAQAQGAGVIFLDFPFWDSQEGRDDIRCLSPEADLPKGAVLAPACAAIRGAGLPNSDLFFDNNHLTKAGNQVVADAVAGAILTSPYAP